MTKRVVSAIIPTYNSEKTLKKCLDSLKNQTYEYIEIIIVDGGSEDNTLKIAKKYTQNIYQSHTRNRTSNINYGAKISKGEFIYRVNHDVVIDEYLIEEAVQKCVNDNYDTVSIFSSPDPTVSFWSKVRKLEKDCYKGNVLFSGAGFFKRDVFEELGGYNENIVFDDCYELNYRLRNANYSIGIISSQELHLGEPKTLLEIAKKQYYYGLTMKEFFKACSNKNNTLQLNPIREPLIKNWKKFLYNPHLTIGFIIYDIVQYSSSLLGLFIASVLGKKSAEQTK